LLHALTACIGLWHHEAIAWLLHALTAWDLKFQVCLGYPTTLEDETKSIFPIQKKSEHYIFLNYKLPP